MILLMGRIVDLCLEPLFDQGEIPEAAAETSSELLCPTYGEDSETSSINSDVYISFCLLRYPHLLELDHIPTKNWALVRLKAKESFTAIATARCHYGSRSTTACLQYDRTFSYTLLSYATFSGGYCTIGWNLLSSQDLGPSRMQDQSSDIVSLLKHSLRTASEH